MGPDPGKDANQARQYKPQCGLGKVRCPCIEMQAKPGPGKGRVLNPLLTLKSDGPQGTWPSLGGGQTWQRAQACHPWHQREQICP